MIKTKRNIGILWLCGCLLLGVQGVVPQTGLNDAGADIPGEAVYVHFNAGLTFSGETLYYTIYCRNAVSMAPSVVSKMAYVALIGKDLQPVFRHKVQLKDGRGQGDFLLPPTVPTGSYKLIAYTQWMKNGNGNPPFQADVFIVNPYLETPGEYVEEVLPDSLQKGDMAEYIQPQLPTSQGNLVQLNLNKERFGKREAVQLELLAAGNEVATGSYSLSVRRLGDLPEPGHISARGYQRDPAGSAGAKPQGSPDVLPEFRGELLSGRVLVKDTGEPVANRALALSMGGDDYLFNLARTNTDGRFYVNLDTPYDQSTAIFQVLGKDRGLYSVELDTFQIELPDNLSFKGFLLNEEMKEAIRNRSIRNQVENAYAGVKSDTLLPQQTGLPFYRDYQETYHLDDFTRFNTIGETLVEIVDNVWLAKDADGDAMFQVRPFDGYLDGVGIPPMVFMDGLFIQDHADIVGFPARQIKNIFFSRDRYQVGAEVFQGILAFETYASDFSDGFYRDYLLRAQLFKPQPPKAYFFEAYSDGPRERIPDFRRQLLWVPSLQLSGLKSAESFYTSDVEGSYEIRLEGFTSRGMPVSSRKIFTVE